MCIRLQRFVCTNFNTGQNLTPGPSPKERGGVKP